MLRSLLASVLLLGSCNSLPSGDTPYFKHCQHICAARGSPRTRAVTAETDEGFERWCECWISDHKAKPEDT